MALKCFCNLFIGEFHAHRSSFIQWRPGQVSLYGLAGGVAARRSIVVLVDRATSVPFTPRHDVSRADNHGQHQDGLDLHRSLAPQVAILPVACKQVVGQGLHRPCRARPADAVPGRGGTGNAHGVRDRTDRQA